MAMLDQTALAAGVLIFQVLLVAEALTPFPLGQIFPAQPMALVLAVVAILVATKVMLVAPVVAEAAH
jgi:hypothetical protein